ncbi:MULTISPECIES: helix-turn-helix domain-containing protein [Paenibacillus]|uniref:helix-turn-helix domain-containing protein n=1 Tax=Paenibacillus TaxID=44249 RepID=UPI00228139B7|nr:MULTISPECIES: helix-turn-helix domain-containing protein [Paenibacillus]MEB8593748.1 helix-turn-helix domain-containing protein [Bacillus cereus]MCY7521043.1 helix-turn-helix domain-containing protein [Paenibacillus larvae]MCY9500679.1 helix-turn-helix domain-containing protein [Paenibacillus larvae]MCY9677539.1 helix-turn-helix domain-containing protein [Paenibacillus larvae]MCY9744714.1 helix-turn-helix domain-containing protein [Paenibacillus larvae]
MERIYAISEVTVLTGITESTLRNWEREFNDYLAVSRDDQGARIYTQQDVERFKMIQLMRKKGFSIGAIKDLLIAFQNGKLDNDEALQVATATEIVAKNTDQMKVLAVLPEQIRNMVQQELQAALSEHREQVTKQIGEIMESRLEKFQKQKKSWWQIWK